MHQYMAGTNPVTTQTMPTIPCETACQGESVISQAWLKQFTAHKATLMYCLYWKKKKKTHTHTVIQQYIAILSHHCSSSHHRQHFVSNKEASHSVSAKKPIHTVGMPRGTSVCSELHKTGFLCACVCVRVCVCPCERAGGGEPADNSLCDCLVRKCSFIPFLLPLIYFLI